jgi:hypothetical protein
MLPILATAGRLLATSAVRGATAGASRAASAGAGKKVINDIISDKVENEIKGNIVRVSTDKFLGKKITPKTIPSSENNINGGALVKTPSSSIVKKQSDNLLLDELLVIKTTLVTIKSLIDKGNLFDREQYSKRKKELEEQKRKSTEDKLEKKPKKIKKIDKGSVNKSGNIFDFISNYLLNIFAGSLANWAFTNLPKIINIIEGISSGIDNTWKVLKFGIISLATNFPKQIKFLAKISAKILGGPVNLIGRLLSKAGNSLSNLLKKAGKSLFGVIEGPLKSIGKKVLGDAGTSSAKASAQTVGKVGKSAIQNASNLITNPSTKKLVGRLKAFSKVFKRVPVIGAILGIAIDMALGEPIDRAVVGAIGASIGGAIGGAIGTGLIPIPLVGTSVGGFVGAAIGDWASKQIYKNLTGRVSEAEKEASKVEVKSGGGKVKTSSVTRTTSSSSLGSELTRETGVSKRTFESGKSKKQLMSRRSPFPISEKAIKNSNNFFGEEQTKYLMKVTDSYKKSNFIGDILRLGIAIAMGENVVRSNTDGIADNMSYEMYNAYERGLIEIDKNIDSNSISYAFRKWARNKIYNEVMMSRRSIQEMKRGSTPSSGSTGGDDSSTTSGGAEAGMASNTKGAPYSFVQSKLGATKEQWDIFRNTIAMIESGGSYNIAGGSGRHYDGRYQLGAAAKTDGSRTAGLPNPGHNPSARQSFRSNPDLQEKLFAGYTVANHNYLMRNKKYKEASILRKLQILGYAHNQGMGGAENWLNTGQVGADGFGTKGTKYTDALAVNLKKGNVGNLSSNITPTQDTETSAEIAPQTSQSTESTEVDYSKFANILGDPKSKPVVDRTTQQSKSIDPKAPFVDVPVSTSASNNTQANISSSSNVNSKANSISQSASYDSPQASIMILPPMQQQSPNVPLTNSPSSAGSRGEFDYSMLNSDNTNYLKQVLSAALY